MMTAEQMDDGETCSCLEAICIAEVLGGRFFSLASPFPVASLRLLVAISRSLGPRLSLLGKLQPTLLTTISQPALHLTQGALTSRAA